MWEVDHGEVGDIRLAEAFLEYLTKRNIARHQNSYSTFSMALELNLELADCYTFLMANHAGRIQFLWQRVRYMMEILLREEKSKDVFHLN